MNTLARGTEYNIKQKEEKYKHWLIFYRYFTVGTEPIGIYIFCLSR